MENELKSLLIYYVIWKEMFKPILKNENIIFSHISLQLKEFVGGNQQGLYADIEQPKIIMPRI